MSSRRRPTARRALVALLPLLLTATPSSAADWQLAAQSDHTDGYFNLESLKRNGEIVTIWAKENYAAAQPAAKKGKTFQSARIEYRFDCAQRRYAKGTIKAYAQPDLGGEEVQKVRSSDKNLVWESAQSMSYAEALLVYACKR